MLKKMLDMRAVVVIGRGCVVWVEYGWYSLKEESDHLKDQCLFKAWLGWDNPANKCIKGSKRRKHYLP